MDSVPMLISYHFQSMCMCMWEGTAQHLYMMSCCLADRNSSTFKAI